MDTLKWIDLYVQTIPANSYIHKICADTAMMKSNKKRWSTGIISERDPKEFVLSAGLDDDVGDDNDNIFQYSVDF